MLTLLVFVVITLGTLAFIIWLFRKADAPGDAGTKQKGDKVELHVAFIHPDLGIGGAERLVVDAALGLQNRGHHVDMFTAHHDQSHCFEETKGRKRDVQNGKLSVIVHGDWLPRSFFGRFHTACSILRNLYVAWQLSRAHKQGSRYDVIFADQISACIPLLKLLTDAKVLFYCHFPDMLLTHRRGLLKRLYRLPIDFIEETTTGMADQILVNSQFTLSVFMKTFTRLKHKSVQVLYPAINFGQYEQGTGQKTTSPSSSPSTPSSPPSSSSSSEVSDTNNNNTSKVDTVSLDTQQNNNYNTDAIFFVSLNRYERKKNINLAIKAFAKLIAIRPQLEHRFHLVIAGGYDSLVRENVEHYQELEALAKELDVSERTTFLRSISNTKRNELLYSCCCVLYTPENEHFGIVPIECMYAGRPVIACNSGGPTESVKNGTTGFLCNPDETAFAEAMAKLVDSYPQQAVTMGKAARKHVKKTFSLESFSKQLEDILIEMVTSS